MPVSPTSLPIQLQWYYEHGQQLIEKYRPDRANTWKKEVEDLCTRHSKLEEPLSICFLGKAGVGKSTLINALVADDVQLLPTTGVGPLTAQALLVKYGRDPSLEVTYHKADKIQRLLFPLEQEYKRRQERTSLADIEQGKIERPETPSKLDDTRKQALKLITGNQDSEADDAYLLDCLYEVLGKTRKWGTPLSSNSEDARRIARLKDVLAKTKDGQHLLWKRGGTVKPFLECLKEHAAGFFSPLIQKLVVTWDSPLLEAGITLIDLPGMGARGDSFEVVTKERIPSARAIVLVVDRVGLDEASADLLYRSEFLKRMIHSARCPEADPVELFVAAVKGDDVAGERYREDKSKKKWEHFQDVQVELRKTIRNQLDNELRNVWRTGDGNRSESEKLVSQRLVEELRVFPLSAIEYRRLLERDEDDAPFLKTLEQSGIPAFKQSLQEIVKERRRVLQESLQQRLTDFVERIVSFLELFRPPEGTTIHESTNQDRQGFLDYIEQKRVEFTRREGALRQLWASESEEMIQRVVSEASQTALARMRQYLGTLSNSDFRAGTLQAAVRRGGSFEGTTQSIALAQDLGFKIDAPIAEGWNDPILRKLGQKTSEFANDTTSLIGEVYAEAKDRELKPLLKPLERLLRSTRADGKRLEAIGNDQTEHLRKEVRNRLLREIEKPIKEACKHFERQGENKGTGVKGRILELFDKLAVDVLERSKPVATRLLTQLVEGVREEVQQIFNNRERDPFDTARKFVEETIPDKREPSEEERRRWEQWQDIEQQIVTLKRLQGSPETPIEELV